MRKSISFLVFVVTANITFGQSLYNGSTISISGNSVLYVKDTIINEGIIVNNGDMQVGGSWINNADYHAGAGQITFNSNEPQVINHNDQSFSRLTLSGGGEKHFLADITIENELNLTDGILVGENNSRIIISESAQVIGGSDISHINGSVYRRGTGNKIFPVGNGSVYLPVEIVDISGTSAEIGVTAFEGDDVTLVPSPSLTGISADRYWQVDVVAGSLDDSRVILPVRDESIATSVDEIVVAQSEDINESFESIGRSAFEGSLTDGRVTSDRSFTKRLLAIGTASAGEGIIVYNAISPGDGDPRNEFLIIGNIENFPENRFSVFNRWGDKVFELDNYDNKERVFRGKSNLGTEKDLNTGTYFYTIETKKDGKRTHGYLSVKR